MKKMLFILSPLLALWLLPVGCKKDPQGPGVAGWVKEFGTDKPIPNASVYGIDCEGEPLGPVTCFKTDTTRADAEGYYSMPKEPGWVGAEAPGYWMSDQVPVLYKKELASNVSLYPFAWLKVTIRNESGIYGFGSSQLLADRLIQPQGQEHSVIKLVKGNDLFTLVFFILLDANTSTTDISNVKVLSESGKELPIDQGVSLSVSLNPIGHDTTNLLIIY